MPNRRQFVTLTSRTLLSFLALPVSKGTTNKMPPQNPSDPEEEIFIIVHGGNAGCLIEEACEGISVAVAKGLPITRELIELAKELEAKARNFQDVFLRGLKRHE